MASSFGFWPAPALWGTKESINEACEAWGGGEIAGEEILEYKLVSKARISYDYKTGDNVFDHITYVLIPEQKPMCNKQETINKLTSAATKLIEKYNAVIQDREWIAMQAVARVNGYTYRGPWIADDIASLAALVIETKKQAEPCSPTPMPDPLLEM